MAPNQPCCTSNWRVGLVTEPARRRWFAFIAQAGQSCRCRGVVTATGYLSRHTLQRLRCTCASRVRVSDAGEIRLMGMGAMERAHFGVLRVV